MTRKGQYMAIEAVFTLGLSLVVAVAAIGIFNGYKNNVMNSIRDRHVSIIRSEVLTTVYNLKNADSGSYANIDIPTPPQGESYRVALENNSLNIILNENEYSRAINGVSWVDELKGSAESDTLKIVKINNDVLLRPS